MKKENLEKKVKDIKVLENVQKYLIELNKKNTPDLYGRPKRYIPIKTKYR